MALLGMLHHAQRSSEGVHDDVVCEAQGNLGTAPPTTLHVQERREQVLRQGPHEHLVGAPTVPPHIVSIGLVHELQHDVVRHAGSSLACRARSRLVVAQACQRHICQASGVMLQQRAVGASHRFRCVSGPVRWRVRPKRFAGPRLVAPRHLPQVAGEVGLVVFKRTKVGTVGGMPGVHGRAHAGSLGQQRDVGRLVRRADAALPLRRAAEAVPEGDAREGSAGEIRRCHGDVAPVQGQCGRVCLVLAPQTAP